MKRLKIVLSLAALVCGCLGKVHAQTPGRHFELRAETPAFWNLIDHDATIAKVAANLTWGDKDYQTLYITATTSVYRLRTKARGFVPSLSR